MSKVPVKVNMDIDTEGVVRPKTITYEDEEYPIEQIIKMLPLNALKTGGGKNGYWYKCSVGGRIAFLLYDALSHKWQMELPAA